MPKKTTRHNPANPERRTVQSAATLLQRISRKAMGSMPATRAAEHGATRLGELRQLLPEELRGHVLQTIEKPSEVVLFADSAVWAARLKLCEKELSTWTAGRPLRVRVMPRGGFRK